MVSLTHPDFELSNFLSIKFLRDFQNRVLCEQSNISQKNIFLKTIRSFFNFFWNWMKKFCLFANKKSIGLSKLESTCP